MPQKKKEYQKPTLERLVLIPKENVLADCFSISGSGPSTNLICANVCFNPLTLQSPMLP